MVLSVGYDPTFAVLGSTENRRPPELEPNSNRVTPATKIDVASPDSRRRLDSPEAAPRPTRIAFTAKFGPDKDGFPLQLISGDQVRGAETNDIQVILENRISQDSQTALLQAQETRDAEQSRRQQDAAAQSRRETDTTASDRIDAQTQKTPESSAAAGSFLDLRV